MKSLFSVRLKERRQELNMTQADLADACGLTNAAISLFEADQQKPHTETILKLSQVLFVSIDYLVGLKEIETEDLLVDSRIREMMHGMMTLSEKEKYMLFRVYQFYSIRQGN